MPAVSRFFGVTIYLYFNDHAPPHFHAEYSEHEAIYEITTLAVLRGGLPRRAHAMVVEWATFHREELVTNWENARRQVPLTPIEPLD